VFPHVRSAVAQVLDLTSRGVRAVEGILAAILTLNQTLKDGLQDQAYTSHLVGPLRDLVQVVARLAVVQQELGPAHERLDALELSRVRWEAECEGLLLKADGKHNAAKAAEARERQLSRSYAKSVADPFPPLGDESQAEGDSIHADNGRGGEAGEVSTVRAAVAPTPHALRLRAKWGV